MEGLRGGGLIAMILSQSKGNKEQINYKVLTVLLPSRRRVQLPFHSTLKQFNEILIFSYNQVQVLSENANNIALLFGDVSTFH